MKKGREGGRKEGRKEGKKEWHTKMKKGRVVRKVKTKEEDIREERE
jgi:hypothetical protein